MMILGTLISLLVVLPALAEPGGTVNIQPEFRQTPIWFWHGPALTCVPAPSHDIAARIAPRTIRERKIAKADLPCTIKVDELRLKAFLVCDERVIETYYSREVMCKEETKPPSTAKAKPKRK